MVKGGRMKIVIDIDENLYTRLFDKGVEFSTDDKYDLERSVRHGKVLPKGHGILIDADCLREDFKASKMISFAERMKVACIVDNAPTIIEADTESEGK